MPTSPAIADTVIYLSYHFTHRFCYNQPVFLSGSGSLVAWPLIGHVFDSLVFGWLLCLNHLPLLADRMSARPTFETERFDGGKRPKGRFEGGR